MTPDIPVKARFSINVIENLQHELLFLKRSMYAELGPGLWGFPAGHIKNNETPEKCAAREITEEIGHQLKMEFIRRFGPVRDYCYGGIYQVWLFHFIWHGGVIKLNDEHTEFDWVGPERFNDLDTMDGIDEDIAWLEIWPLRFLDKNKLPAHLR